MTGPKRAASDSHLRRNATQGYHQRHQEMQGLFPLRHWSRWRLMGAQPKTVTCGEPFLPVAN